MTREGLDRRDLRILAELRANSRITILELAKRVNLAPTPCRIRVNRLIRDKYIERFTIEIGRGRHERRTKYTLIDIAVPGPEASSKIGTLLKTHPSVTAIYMIEGKYDLLVRIDEVDFDKTVDIINDLQQSRLVKDTFTVSVLASLYTIEDSDNLQPPEWWSPGP